jgi:hypothetical protein
MSGDMGSFLSGQVHGDRDQRRGEREQGASQHPLNIEISALIPRERAHQCTIEFICRMGIRIEKATKAITAPIKTIIMGSSSAVSAPMRTFTLDS